MTDNGRGIPVDIHPIEEDARRGTRDDRAPRRRQVRQVHATRCRAACTAWASRWSTPSRSGSRSRWTATAAGTTWRSSAGRPRKPLSVARQGQGHRHHGHLQARPRDLLGLEFSYKTLADRLRQLAFLNKGHHDQAHATNGRTSRKRRRSSRKGGMVEFVEWLNRNKKALHPKPVAFSAAQGRRRGGRRPPVRGRLQREHLHLRQQHQHARGRHPPDRLPLGPHPHA